jgi:tetratricopeptide (TPR) repeat protein
MTKERSAMRILLCCMLASTWTCCAQTSDASLKSKELCIEAAKLMRNSFSDPQKVKNALRILDEAIAMDSLNAQAYLSKATCYCRLNNRRAALKTLDRLLQVNPNTVGALNLQGFILVKMGLKKEARPKFLAEIGHCDEELAKSPSDSTQVRLKLVRAIAFWFGYGRIKARNEYQELVTQYPDEESVQSIRPLFYDTSKKEFLRQW